MYVEPDIRTMIAERIKSLGTTVNGIAVVSGVSHQSIRDYLAGSGTSIDTVMKIMASMGLGVRVWADPEFQFIQPVKGKTGRKTAACRAEGGSR